MKSLFALAVALMFAAQPTLAAEPPTDPILRIETGMHTAMISRIATDAFGRWLVTASYDKSLRVWELPACRLVRTIRPPIGEGNDGQLYSVALSPDGSTIACGGWTQFNSGQTALASDGLSIYLFNRASGNLTARITGLPNVINHLAFSPDGRFLAASLGGNDGIRLYRTADWSLAAEDKEYGSASYSAHFGRDGRLLTTSYDGFIRLYDLESGSLSLTAKVKAPGGSRPSCARFSPDANRVGVSYQDTTSVSVLSGRDLTLLYSPDTAGVQNGSLRNLAWSADGRDLFAGGGYHRQFDDVWKVAIRRWADGGRGSSSDSAAADNTIMDLTPLPDGRIVYVASDPAFGLLDQIGQRTLFVPNAIADHRGSWDGFRVSRDGTTVGFGYEQWGKSPASFNLTTRSLVQGSASVNLQPPITTADGLAIDGWKNTTEPKLNGTPLKLQQYDISRSLAIAPDGNSFVIGTEWYLRRFDRQGKQLWQVTVPGVVWAVNVAANVSVVVAAYGEGTIRWHRMSDGKELMAFFPHADKKRWVLWTPEGYFDASPGGAELIGYHINQGKDKEARFVPMSYLYDVFYRPDIIQAMFNGEDISSLITLTAQEALKTPPPEVKFTSIPQESPDTRVKVCYQIKSTGGGIGEVRLFQNGKLIKSDGFYREVAKKESTEKIQLAALNSRAIYNDQRGLVVKDKKANNTALSKPKGDLVDECVEIEPIEGENEISLAAFNGPNTVQGFMDTATFISTRKPDEPHLYILSVGIDNYRDSSINLKYAAKDAKDFIAKLPAKAATIYKPENIHVISLSDAQAGKVGIVGAIEQLSGKVKQGDGFIFFNASHGALLQNQYYIVTADFDGDLSTTKNLISSNEIVEMSKRIKSLSQLFIFDTCHAGGIDNIVSGLYDARMSVMAKKMGLHIYSSAGSVQTAMDGYQGNGLYTYTLLQGVANGKEVDTEHDGKVTVKKLGRYSKEKTTEISTMLGHPQTPFIIDFGRDNPLFAVQ